MLRRADFADSSFAYVETTIPAGMTIAAYRRTRPPARRRRRLLEGIRRRELRIPRRG
jgi:hypothetical protein